MGMKITMNHDRLSLRKWVFSLEETELKIYLEDAKLLTTGTLNELRKRFSRYIPSIPDEQCKEFLIKARAYIESLVYQNLTMSDEKKMKKMKDSLLFLNKKRKNL